ncbi:MAG: CHASE2 domain-containing protein [Muribaculaceae bacterium]|nr:CHASE2 domain-containing protein [Muribaculaceae bacterium]
MMIKASQKRTWLLLAAKATGITGIAFLLSFIISSPFAATISALFSSSEKSDFVMSDLFYQIADSRPVRMYDDRMVMLDIGNSNREEIAEILSVVALCGPKAVAIDVNFEIPGDNDSILLESLSSLPALVLPLGVGQKGEKFVVTDHPFFYADLPGIRYGVVNFPTSRPGATVREYAKSFPMEDGAAMLSFPEAAAKAAGYETAIPPGQKDVPTGIIAYHSREITTIPHEELADRAEELADKIVLVGTTTEAGDVYSIPLRHGVSGLEIHAYSLSTILDGMEMERLPGYIATIIAVVICYLMVLGAIGIRSGTKGLILRIAQILTLYVLVRVGYSLFVDKGIVSDFSQAILMIAFGLFSVDLWNGTVCLIDWIKAKIKAIKAKKRELTT